MIIGKIWGVRGKSVRVKLWEMMVYDELLSCI